MQYLVTLIALLLAEVAYIVVARRFGIGAPVAERSSHKEFTPTGGGIIFPIAVLLFALFNHTHLTANVILMIAGMCVLAAVSMMDDIKELSPVVRLVVQILVVGAVFYQFIAPATLHIFLILLICGVGFINAFNFMDGINGIMTVYSAVTLSALTFAFARASVPADSNLFQIIIYSGIAVLVFSIFNLRRRAVIFAGDVGSISLGFVIMYLMASLIISTVNAAYVVFLMVYAVDTVLTIMGRLFDGENIFLPHRRHLYEMLVNQGGHAHHAIALAYAAAQLAIDVAFFFMPQQLQWTFVIIVTITLVTAYFVIKGRVQRRARRASSHTNSPNLRP